MPLPLAGALVETDDVLVPPVRVMSLPDHDIRRLDKGPFEVIVGLFDHPALVGLARAGLRLGYSAGVAGKVLGAGEAVDRSHFPVDHDGEDFGRSRHRLDQLDSPGAPHPLEDAGFQAVDMALDQVQQFELLLYAAVGLLRQGAKQGLQPGAPRPAWAPAEAGPDACRLWVDPIPLDDPAPMVEDGKDGEVLMRVTSDLIMRTVRHVAPPCALASWQLPV